jgi:hypothetical protein
MTFRRSVHPKLMSIGTKSGSVVGTRLSPLAQIAGRPGQVKSRSRRRLPVRTLINDQE